VQIDWILLIYSLPSHPSRKRAYVWRELKKLGAIYLRDGVALLPRNTAVDRRLGDVAERIQEYAGTVELVLSPAFLNRQPERFVDRFNADRTDEYRELHHECVHFLRDVLEDVDAATFGFPDVDKLDNDLHRLQRWLGQVRERDYFDAPGLDRVEDMLAKCERAFEQFASRASEREKRPLPVQSEDVFERLGGPANVPNAQDPELPL